MASDKVGMLRAAYDAYRRGDIETMLRGVGPEVITYRDEPDGATFQGPEGMAQAFADWTEDFDDFEATLEEVVDVRDDRVVLRVRQRGTGSHSGIAIESDFWFIHTFENGRPTRLDMFANRDRAYDAAGLES